MLERSYDRILAWAGHPRAPWYLALLSFAEASFFPIPPDVLLAPMVLARPERALPLAGWTTLASVAGGVAGFALGALAIDSLQPILVANGYAEPYQRAQLWFGRWGFWAVLIAGFSPIPYKAFALAAGSTAMSLPLFVLASLIGRGGRFFLVAGLVALGGRPLAATLRHHIDRIGWWVAALTAAAYLVL